MSMRYVDNGPSKNQYFSKADNDKCVELIRGWREKRVEALKNGTPQDAPVPELLGYHIQRICENISFRYNYRDHPFREDMVQDAVLNMMRYLHGFDPDRIAERTDKVNFFGWVTSCVDRSFSNTITTEKLQDYYKLATFANMGGFNAFADDEEVLKDTNLTSEMAQDIISRAREFEEKRTEKIQAANERAKQRELEKMSLSEEQTQQTTANLFRFFRK